jgi:hypothetical protein
MTNMLLIMSALVRRLALCRRRTGRVVVVVEEVLCSIIKMLTSLKLSRSWPPRSRFTNSSVIAPLEISWSR